MRDSSTYFACAIAVFIVGAMTVGGLANAAVLYEKIYWVPAAINFLVDAYAIIKLVSLGRKANVEAAKAKEKEAEGKKPIVIKTKPRNEKGQFVKGGTAK